VRDPLGEDEGIADKRLLVVQGEFASTLKIMEREGNILSAILRDAWDSGRLGTMTRRKNALRATGAHVSVIGHITRDELRRYLSATESANGFANRFLWIVVNRSKLLPEGGVVRVAEHAAVLEKLRAVIAFSCGVGEMRRDQAARKLWCDVYEGLTERPSCMFGAITSRAEAQTLRLSCIYALLDRSSVVTVEHLRAALAVWDYAEASAKYIFGETLGDPVADTILTWIKESDGGRTKTEIRDLFGRNKSSARIDTALDLLKEHGKITMLKETSGGRPTERYMYVGSTTKTR
jgi:Protein of unknown function (DUF3987)